MVGLLIQDYKNLKFTRDLFEFEHFEFNLVKI